MFVRMYVCIIDADAPSYVSSNTSWQALANRAANQKKAKYQRVVEELRGSITPLVCSTDGVLHHEYAAYQRRLAHRLSARQTGETVLRHHGMGSYPHAYLQSFAPSTCVCEVAGESRPASASQTVADNPLFPDSLFLFLLFLLFLILARFSFISLFLLLCCFLKLPD